MALRYKHKYGQAIPVEVLVQHIADHKQSYTQFGGLRPYGVSFIFAGWWDVWFTFLSIQLMLYQNQQGSKFRLSALSEWSFWKLCRMAGK